MSTDYAAVAGAAVLGTPGVRVCLVVSRDGLSLGASPASEERRAASLWVRLSALGRVTRGFVTVDNEIWACSQDERHGVLLVADRAVPPGVLLEIADEVVAATKQKALAADAKEGRDGGDARETRETRSQVVRKIRTALHPDAKIPAAAEPAVKPEPAHVVVSLEATSESAPSVADQFKVTTPGPVRHAAVEDAGDPPDAPSETSDEDELEASSDAPLGGRGDIDVVALAREFSGLLFDREDG